MLKLDLKREEYWLDLGHGVKVSVLPLSTALVMSARTEAAKSPFTDESEGMRAARFIRELALRSLLDWEGVYDEKGELAKFEDDNIYALMDLWPIADAFERLYLGPSLILEQEKNG